MKDGYIFYRSFYESIKRLPAEEFKNCVVAISEYALDDIEPSTEGIERTVFELVKPQVDANNRRYENGKKGGRPKNQEEPNQNQTETKPKPNVTNHEPKEKEKVKDKVKDKDIKKKDTNVSKEKATRFSPPTVDEVRDYVEEKGYTVDPERFCDFYETKGWMVGKNKMKDWKSAVRNWSRSQRQEVTTKASKFSNFTERQYNKSELIALIEM